MSSKSLKPETVKNEQIFPKVEKTFYEIQLDAKEKIIARLEEHNSLLEKTLNKYNIKTKNLIDRFKSNWEYGSKMLEEKQNIEKLIKEETEDLFQEKTTMVETNIKMLKEKDDEFMKEARVINSIAAVYVGCSNKLNEFTKQEEILQQKLENIKNKILYICNDHDLQLERIELKYIHNKKAIQRKFLKQCNDFAIQIRKQPMLYYDEGNLSIINYLIDELKLCEEYNSMIDEQILLLQKRK